MLNWLMPPAPSLWIAANDSSLKFGRDHLWKTPISHRNMVGFDENGVEFIASVYPGECDHSNGDQKEHKKIKKLKHYPLWKFILLLTNHLPDKPLVSISITDSTLVLSHVCEPGASATTRACLHGALVGIWARGSWGSFRKRKFRSSIASS